MSPVYTHILARHCFNLSFPSCSPELIQGLDSPKSMRLVERDDIDVAPIPTQPTTILKGGLRTVWHEMPIDILYEVFSHLHPNDLLNLSRTTRSLREIVTTRRSRDMWRSSLASVGALPSCPPDLTEIQYANLAFNNHCHFCLAPDVHEIFWICRVRSCTKCIPKYFRSEDELELQIPEDVISEKPDSIFPYIASQRTDKNGGKSLLYYVPAAEEYLRELDDILPAKAGDAFTKWIQKKKDMQTLRVSHAQLCQYWTYPRPQRPNRYEEIIVLALFLILSFLWRDHITSMIDVPFNQPSLRLLMKH